MLPRFIRRQLISRQIPLPAPVSGLISAETYRFFNFEDPLPSLLARLTELHLPTSFRSFHKHPDFRGLICFDQKSYSTAVSNQVDDGAAPVEPPSEMVRNIQMVVQICEILEAKTWGIATSKRLEALDFSYTSDIVASVVRAASSSTAALGFFNWLTMRGFDQDPQTYGAIIDVLGEVGSIDDMKYLADEMRKSALVLDTDIYDTLIHWCVRHGDPLGASSFLDQMKREGILMSPLTYTSMLDLHVKEGRYEDAVTLYLQMIEEGIVPSSYTLSLLIRCLLEAGKLEPAQVVFTALTKIKVQPNISAFAYLMAAHAKAGDQKLLSSLGQEMRNIHGRPGKIFCVAFKSLHKEGNLKEADAFAKEVWPELSDEERRARVMDVGGVSTLEESEKDAFRDDLGYLISPKVRISLSEATKLLEHEGLVAFEQLKLEWTDDTVYKVLKLLQNPHKAWDFFQWLKSSPGFKPDIINEVYLLRKLIKSPDVPAWKELLCELQTRGVGISLDIFNTLIKDCALAKNAGAALWIYSRIKDFSIKPNEETFISLVHALARGRNPDKALDLCTVMLDLGIKLDVETYTAVIHSLGLAGRSDDAWAVYQKMIAAGHKPTANTYTALLNMMNLVGDTGFAIKLYKEMNANGIAPTEATQGIMAKIWEASGNRAEAEKLDTERRFLSSKRRENSLQQIYEILLEGLVEQERSPSLLCLAS